MSGIFFLLSSLLYGGATPCFRNALSSHYPGSTEHPERLKGEGLAAFLCLGASTMFSPGLFYADPDRSRANTLSWV